MMLKKRFLYLTRQFFYKSVFYPERKQFFASTQRRIFFVDGWRGNIRNKQLHAKKLRLVDIRVD